MEKRELAWLRTGKNGGKLRRWQRPFGFQKTLRFSWLVEKPFNSQA
jgi:hypothetical protein